jgi:AAA+ superfamily predicted ATPase
VSWTERRAEKRRQKVLARIDKTRETNPELADILLDYVVAQEAAKDVGRVLADHWQRKDERERWRSGSF